MSGARPLSILVDAVNGNADPRGPDRYLDRLLQAVAELGTAHRATVLHAPWQRLFAGRRYGEGIRCREVAPPRGAAERVIWHARRFAALAGEEAPDVVFLPNLIWTPGLAAPSVVCAHDLAHFRAPEKFGRAKARLLRPVIRRALRRADRVIAVSEFTAGDVVRYAGVPRDRIDVIPEGGPPPRPRPPGAERGAEPPVFLFVGKLERSKGVDTLLRAFAGSDRLAALGATLDLVGPDGNAARDIAALAAASGGRVRRRGFLPEAELERLYRRCRAFVFPSEAEGFGLALLEAMAHDAPVIAARAMAVPEVVGDAALLVPPRDPAALAAAMERLAETPDLAARLAQAGRRNLARFSWTRAAERTLSALEAAARPRAGAETRRAAA